MVLFILITSTSFIRDPTEPIPSNITSYFLFAQNLAWPHPKFFGEAWSLAIEEWFYLCIPIPLYLSTKLKDIDRRKVMLWCIAIVIILSVVFRIYRVKYIGYTSMTEWKYGIGMQVITRMDSLMIGVFGAYLSLYKKSLWVNIAPYSFAFGTLLLAFDMWMHSGGYQNMLYFNYFSLTVTPLATLLLLPKLSNWYANRVNILVKFVTFISLISYSMYLLNQAPILETILPLIMPRVMYYLWPYYEYMQFISYFIYWMLTIFGAFLLYNFFERPVMNLRDSWSVISHTKHT